jgi:hypothetical protein
MKPERNAMLGEWWCRAMHTELSTPKNGRYQCLQCRRVYVVPWLIIEEAGFCRTSAGYQVEQQNGWWCRARQRLLDAVFPNGLTLRSHLARTLGETLSRAA